MTAERDNNSLTSAPSASGASGPPPNPLKEPSPAYAQDHPLQDILDAAIEQAKDGRITLGALLVAWGDRSYGPLFIALGFFAGTPLSIFPGMSAATGAVIAIVALQMIFGMAHIWLPGPVLRQSVALKSLIDARDKSQGPLDVIDRIITRRWAWATGEAMRRAAAIIVFLLALVMIPFDAVPFIVAAPSWGVVLFGLAIAARDGLIMLVAMAAALGIGVFAAQMIV